MVLGDRWGGGREEEEPRIGWMGSGSQRSFPPTLASYSLLLLKCQRLAEE